MHNGLRPEVCSILQETLPVFTRRGSGGTYDYHKGEDVIRHLNKAFSHTWSSEVISQEEKYDQVLILVALQVWTAGDVITHQGFGSSQIAKNTKTGSVMDIGNSYKSAYTNALKKAAEQFGIGLGADEPVLAATSPSPATSPAPRQPAPAQQATPTRQSTTRSQIKTPTSLPPRGGVATKQPSAPQQEAPPQWDGPSMSTTAPRNQVASAVEALENEAQAAFAKASPSPDEPINPNQVTALLGLMEMRNSTEPQLISEAVEGTTKTAFNQLTRLEAVSVIRYASNLAV